MKNKWILLFFTALLTMSMACASLLPKSADAGVVAGNINQNFVPPPPYDPKAPLPSPGAAALRALEASEPGVSILESDVEAAERAAFKTALADLQTKLGAGKTSQATAPLAQSGGVMLAMSAHKFSVPAGSNPPVYLGEPIDTTPTASLISGLLSGLNDIFLPNVPAGPGVSGSFPETVGGTTTTNSLNLSRDADGATHFGFGTKTESTKNGVSAKVEIAGNLDGQRCPNADGQVAFTVKERIGVESGGSGYTQDLTAKVRAVVDDAAKVSSFTVDVTQGTRQVKPGHQVYVETGETLSFDGANFAQSNTRMIRNSQDATQADASDLSASGHTSAERMGWTALKMAEYYWLDGGCTRIEAASPGTVKPGTTTAIPVTVLQRFDGSVLSTKLEAALTGAQSIEPTSLAKTPGILNYTSSQETGSAATITLTATSRRGKANLQLTANTGGQTAYRIVGGSGEWQTNTAVCDIMKPFTLSSDVFTSNYSGGLSGTSTYTTTVVNLHGTGTYTISLPDGEGKPGTMIEKGTGIAEGTYTGSGTAQYRLTPIDPAAGCTQ